jgi:hypothetical protein
VNLLTEEVSEPQRELVFVVKTTPYVVPVAKRVFLFLKSTTFPGVGAIAISASPICWDGQELFIMDGDGGLTGTRTVSFAGPVAPGDASTANSAGAVLHYIYSAKLNVWKKV